MLLVTIYTLISLQEQYIVESINGSFNQFVTAHIKHLSPGNTYGIKVNS